MTKNEAAADALKKAEAERQAKRRGAARLNKAMRKALAGMTPPDDLTVTQWAEAKRRLSAESAAEPGPWRTERTPYLREPMLLRTRRCGTSSWWPHRRSASPSF